MLDVPALSRRAAREQSAFRAVLDAMSRPGTVGQVEPHDQGEHFAAALTVLESLLDHEVTFAVLPEAPIASDPLLRYTGSRVAAPEQADFLLCHGPGIAEGLRAAKVGDLEYPDRSGTIVALVDTIGKLTHQSERLRLSGPGIRDFQDIDVAGFTSAHQTLFARRNVGAPIGIDAILVAPDGRFICLPRYTRIEGTR